MLTPNSQIFVALQSILAASSCFSFTAHNFTIWVSLINYIFRNSRKLLSVENYLTVHYLPSTKQQGEVGD